MMNPAPLRAVRSRRLGCRGQALLELVLLVPVLAAAVCGGIVLSHLAVGQIDVHLAALAGCSASDPAAAAREQLAFNLVSRPETAAVEVARLGQLTKVTVRYPAPHGWWVGRRPAEVVLSATAARGRALLCTRKGR